MRDAGNAITVEDRAIEVAKEIWGESFEARLREMTLIKDAIRQAILDEREACAEIANRIALYVEHGARELEPGERLRQVGRLIRSRP